MKCGRCDNDTTAIVMVDGISVCMSCLNKEGFDKGEKGYYKCNICGDYVYEKRYVKGTLKKGLCFSCSFWDEKKLLYSLGVYIVINRQCFTIMPENREGSRGFGGRRFTIRKYSGEIITTTNLWCQGEISPYFKASMPDNAEFV